jgi:hypothetical protein
MILAALEGVKREIPAHADLPDGRGRMRPCPKERPCPRRFWMATPSHGPPARP